MLEPCVSAMVTTRAYLLEPKHGNIYGRVVDGTLVHMMMELLPDLFTKQISNDESVIKKEVEKKQVAKPFLKVH